MPGMETISDAELEKIGLYVPNNADNLYNIDEKLIHLRKKVGYLNITAEMKDKEFSFEIHARMENGGSNCWAIHGNLTESGQPILTCDPHLAKMVSGFWYATRISWTEGNSKTYIAGGSNVGIPLFTYQVTPTYASGVTALNPDVLDLFVEEVKDDSFLAADGTFKPFQIIKETIKVRLGRDVDFEIRFTDNGVVMPVDILQGKTQQLNLFLVSQMWEQND